MPGSDIEEVPRYSVEPNAGCSGGMVMPPVTMSQHGQPVQRRRAGLYSQHAVVHLRLTVTWCAQSERLILLPWKKCVHLAVDCYCNGRRAFIAKRCTELIDTVTIAAQGMHILLTESYELSPEVSRS